MNVYNPIPSTMGAWDGGATTKNIPVVRVFEDPIFRKSHQSYLIQLAVCIAYALLQRETPPTPRVKKYGIHKMFDAHLSGICYKAAAKKDPHGIVRK